MDLPANLFAQVKGIFPVKFAEVRGDKITKARR